MNLVTVIENVEIERSNNKQLGEAMNARLETQEGQIDALLAQSRAFSEQLTKTLADIQKARATIAQEFADRDAALASLIGGE